MVRSSLIKAASLIAAIAIGLSVIALPSLAASSAPHPNGHEPVISHANITDISFPPGSPGTNGWAVGMDTDNKAVILSQGAAGTWILNKKLNTTPLNSIAMLSNNSGYAVGNNGTIYQYDGKKWNGVDSHTHANLGRIKLGPNGIVFAVGDDQTVIATIAGIGGGGGSSWLLLRSVPGGGTLNSGSVVSDGGIGYFGYVVGANGLALKYTSLTNTWITMTTGITTTLSDINMSDQNNGFATTFDGNVVQYTSGTWTPLTTLPLSGNGVLDLRNGGLAGKSGKDAHINGRLVGASAVVVGNIGTDGYIGVDRGGGWSQDNISPGKTLNYLTIDARGTVWAVGTDGTMITIQ